MVSVELYFFAVCSGRIIFEVFPGVPPRTSALQRNRRFPRSGATASRANFPAGFDVARRSATPLHY